MTTFVKHTKKNILHNISDDIVKLYDNDKCIIVIDAFADNGYNTSLFLKNDRISRVISCQVSNDFNHNISKLDKNLSSKLSICTSLDLLIINNETIDACVFIDNNTHAKIEDIVINYPTYAFIAKINPRYMFNYNKLNDWKITENTTNNSFTIIKGIKYRYDMIIPYSNICFDVNSKQNVQLETFNTFVKDIPICPSVNFADNDIVFMQEFKNFICVLLSKIYKFSNSNDNIKNIEYMTNDDNMCMWRRAFTHESFDKNNNYEVLELLGDANCARSFKNKLTELFDIDKISPRELSEFKAQYMSTLHQSGFSTKLNFRNWCIKDPLYDHGKKLDEDLFESFTGALDFIGSGIEPGHGSVLCDAFIGVIIYSINFNSASSLGIAKTTLLQRFERMYLDKPIIKGDTMEITDQCLIDILKVLPHFPNDKIIGRKNKGDDDNELYTTALSFLENNGLTHVQSNEIKSNRLRDKNNDKYNKIMKETLKHECDDFEIVVFKASDDKNIRSKCVRIYAVKKGGNNDKDKYIPISKMFNYSVEKNQSDINYKIRAMNDFTA
jgi:hypothetical protein